MKGKKLQVFVSSTFTDLKEERQAAVSAILSAGHIPAGMELFNAGDETQMTVIKRWIDESDVYLLILGGRYGSMETTSGKSYTHLEYEYAIQQKKPLFAVVINDEALEVKVKLHGSSVMETIEPQKLKEFRSLVTSNLVKFWDDSKDIMLAIYATLSEFAYNKELVGWVRGDLSVNTGLLAEEIAALSRENSELRKSLSEVGSNASILYSGLTFSELELILTKIIVDYENSEMNLFDFIMNHGEDLISGIIITTSSFPTWLSSLRKFKLVQRVGINSRRYSFSEDGHKFYLRTLVNPNP
jgi:hypothetical protein